MEVKTYPRLFAKASTGKVKFWEISVQGGADSLAPAEILICYGYLDQDEDKHQKTSRTIRTGKNIGRANQTTPFEQACQEAEALHLKKQDKNYSAVLSESPVTLLPMLAHDYKKRKHAIVFDAFVQPKLDGLRCLARRVSATEVEYLSRGGKKFQTLSHLTPALLKALAIGEVLDGEVFTRDLTFQQICSAAKGVKTQTEDPTQLQYWAYDLVNTEMPFHERNAQMLVRTWGMENEGVVYVPTFKVASEEEIFSRHQAFLQQGFEGTMIRNREGFYRTDFRSPDLQKFKDFEDAEFVIVGAKEGVGKSEGQVTWICTIGNDGQTFEARPRGTDEQRRFWWAHKEDFYGQLLTVRYQNLSDSGIPRFPVGVGIREDL